MDSVSLAGILAIVTTTRLIIHTLKHILHTYSAKKNIVDKNLKKLRQDNEIEHILGETIPVKSSNYKYNVHFWKRKA